VHHIPGKLREMIRSADVQGIAGNYDDIGIIVVDPASLASSDDAQIVMGGTNPVEEHAYQKKMRDSVSNDEWISLKDLPERTSYVNMCGIRVKA